MVIFGILCDIWCKYNCKFPLSLRLNGAIFCFKSAARRPSTEGLGCSASICVLDDLASFSRCPWAQNCAFARLLLFVYVMYARCYFVFRPSDVTLCTLCVTLCFDRPMLLYVRFVLLCVAPRVASNALKITRPVGLIRGPWAQSPQN